MNIMGKFTKWSLVLATVLAGLSLGSCDSVIYDDEGDCEPYYRIKFKYDMNMKFADAFSSEVKSVTLYAFDKSGTLVSVNTENGDRLKAADYYMELNVEPGEYDLLAWCGLEGSTSFSVPDAVVGSTKLDDMKCWLNREHDAEGKAHNFRGTDGLGRDLTALYHGLLHVTLPKEYGTYYKTISLTKDTNVVRVVLQHLSGEDVDPGAFRYEITDDNGWLGSDNLPLADEYIHYAPWSVTTGSADIDADISGRATSVSVALAEFTVSRLMKTKRPILTIYNVEENKRVLSVPIVDYALLVKGHYNVSMTDQDYLDRQDEYNLTFFLDESGSWVSAVIYVNSWRVVLQNSDLQ